MIRGSGLILVVSLGVFLSGLTLMQCRTFLLALDSLSLDSTVCLPHWGAITFCDLDLALILFDHGFDALGHCEPTLAVSWR